MKKKTNPARPRPFVVITGMSGSGKGSVLRAFEDLGYYCVDHLPVNLIPNFADFCASREGRVDGAAVVVDIREGKALARFPEIFQGLRRTGLKTSLVFLEASDAALVRRFEETRRPHPAGRNRTVREGIRLERKFLKPMRRMAGVVIDTSRMNVHELRDFIETRFGAGRDRRAMLVSVMSFSYRYGVPTDADLVFDVRFLPNPNFVPRLKNRTGRDPAVRKFMDAHPETGAFVRRLLEFLLYLFPGFIREGKCYLTVAVGCTGGRHRSVAVAEKISQALMSEGYKVKTSHRDIARAA